MNFFSRMSRFCNVRTSIVSSFALGVSLQNYYSKYGNNVIADKGHLKELENSISITSNIYSSCRKPDPYPNFALKDIHDYPISISRTLLNGGRLSCNNEVVLFENSDKNKLLNVENLILNGENKNALSFAEKLMDYLSSFKSVSCINDINELKSIEECASDKYGLCYVSELDHETIHKLPMAKFTISNEKSIVDGCDIKMYSGRETFLSSIAALTLVSLWFSQNKLNAKKNDIRVTKVMDSLKFFSTYCGMTLNTKNTCKHIANQIYENKKLCIYAKHFAAPIAAEGCKKIKEITNNLYECESVTEFEDIEINDNQTIIMIILDDEYLMTMKKHASQIIKNGGKVVIITDVKETFGDNDENTKIIPIPSNECLTSPLALIPISLIGYEMAILCGVNPDGNN